MCAELMGYNIPVLEWLVANSNAEIHVIHWDHKKLTVYKAPVIKNVIYYNRSELDKNGILNLARSISPDIAYVPNWYDRGYLKTCRYLRRRNIPVVSGLDNQWHHTLKQYFGLIVMKLYLKKHFSNMWVAGPYQFEFAKRLGFDKDTILFNLYSADVEKFSVDSKKEVPNNLKFLFIGRLEEVKGIKHLLDAWNLFAHKSNCTLTIIGDGSLQNLVEGLSDVIYHKFMQPDALAVEVKRHNCFVLPSIFEPYGVVIHELCCAGMPIIASDACGAVPLFVIPDYNGLVFKAGNTNDLLQKMNKMYNKTAMQRLEMMNNSIERSTVITPEISARSFISAIKLT